MKHLIIGDVHGYFGNLREFLIEQGAIDEHNNRINKDTLKVYCSGDLIDGHFNREGDLMLLAFADEWFDQVAIGNHEWAFCGGQDFGGARRHDRDITRGILTLIEKGLYVPSFVVEGHLVVHAGLAARWRFESAESANAGIHTVWNMLPAEDEECPLFDWIGPERAGKFSDPTGGIFWLDWEEWRNPAFNQIVGHSTYPSGPICMNYERFGTRHWNIDVGGKTGHCLGGVVIENGNVEPVFWGERFRWQTAEEIVETSETEETESGESYDEKLDRIADEILAAERTNSEEGEETEEERLEREFFQNVMEEPSHYSYLSYIDD